MIIPMNQVLWLARIWLCIALVSATAILSRAADISRESQVNDIREAVFRYQFEHNASGQQQSAHDYYLAIGDKDSDPSDEFMKRFAHHKPPVRKASASRIVPSTGAVVNRRNGRTGLLFNVSAITWVSDTEVNVIGGYSEGNVSASGDL